MVGVFGVGTQLLYAFFFFLIFLNSVISLPTFTMFIVYQYFLFFHFFTISLSVQPQSSPFPGFLSCLSIPLASFPPKAFRPQFCSRLSSRYQSPRLWTQNPFSHTKVDTRHVTCAIDTHSLRFFSGADGAVGTPRLLEKLPLDLVYQEAA